MMFFSVTDVSRSFRVHIYYWDVFTSIFPFYYYRSRVPHTNPASLPFDRKKQMSSSCTEMAKELLADPRPPEWC